MDGFHDLGGFQGFGKGFAVRPRHQPGQEQLVAVRAAARDPHADGDDDREINRQHHVVGAVAHRADLDRDAVLVLDDRADRCAGLDGLQLLDESLRQHRAAAGQTGGAQVAIAHIAVHAGLLREIQQ